MLPKTVEAIGNEAFADCSRLKSITMRANTVKMGTNVFKGCAVASAGSVGSDYIFTWRNTIPENAFSGCNNIQSVEYIKKFPG